MNAKRFFYILNLILILSIGSIAGAYYWGNNKLKAEAETISILKADRDITQEKIIELQKAQKDTEDIEDINNLLDTLLPVNKEQEELVVDIIYTATGEAGIPFNQVRSFTFSGSNEPGSLSGTVISTSNPGVYEYPFGLQIESISFETLLKFFQEVESNGRIIQVDNVQIAPDDANPAILDVTLSMKAYLKP